jgi:hypothetical protein
MAVNVTFDLEVPEKYRSDYADAGRRVRGKEMVGAKNAIPLFHGHNCVRHEVSII